MNRKFLPGDTVEVLSADNRVGRVVYVFSDKEHSAKDITVEFSDGSRVNLSEGEFVLVDL